MHSIQLEEKHQNRGEKWKHMIQSSQSFTSQNSRKGNTAISSFEYCNSMVNLGTIKWLFSSRLLACSVISEIFRESLCKCYISNTEYYSLSSNLNCKLKPACHGAHTRRKQEHADEDVNSIIVFNDHKAGQDKAERQDTPGSHK